MSSEWRYCAPIDVPAAMSAFVHQGQACDVEAVMVDGRWLMRDGTVCRLDEELIMREVDRIGRAAQQRLFAERPDLSPPSGVHSHQ